jgi:acyl carrier protein
MNESQQRLAQHVITGLNLEDITPADIDPQAPLFGEGLGLDSIDALELAVIVERSYGIRIPNMEVGKTAFASIAALDDFINSQPAKPASSNNAPAATP